MTRHNQRKALRTGLVFTRLRDSLSSEGEASLASAISKRLHPPVEDAVVAVEVHLVDALLKCARRNALAHLQSTVQFWPLAPSRNSFSTEEAEARTASLLSSMTC